MKKYLVSFIFLVIILTYSSVCLGEQWVCPGCGNTNIGNFCPVCGTEKPKLWICDQCKTINYLNFCEMCGAKKSNNMIDQVLRMDGSSMADTLLNGDALLIKNVDVSSYQLFDIVVCTYPGREDVNFIKRLTGMPGDYLRIDHGYLYINGIMYEEAYVNDDYRIEGGSNGLTFEEVYVPKAGDILKLDYLDESRTRIGLYVNDKAWGWRGLLSDAISDTGDSLVYKKDGSLFLNGSDISDNMKKIISLVGKPFYLSHDLFFVMGDCRNNSNDSRAQGPLSADYLRGIVVNQLRYDESTSEYVYVQ